MAWPWDPALPGLGVRPRRVEARVCGGLLRDSPAVQTVLRLSADESINGTRNIRALGCSLWVQRSEADTRRTLGEPWTYAKCEKPVITDHECRGLMDAKRLSRQSLETGSRLVTTGAEGLGARAAVAAVRGFPGSAAPPPSLAATSAFRPPRERKRARAWRAGIA